MKIYLLYGFILGGFVFTPAGYVLCAIMASGKRADEELRGKE